eukprot:gene3925-14001_t
MQLRSVNGNDLDSLCTQAESSPSEPSWTLVVQNVAPQASDEELSTIFASFGDIRSMYTARKLQGLILVSYFDLRAAIAVHTTLQGTLIFDQELNISYLPPTRTSQEFGGVGQGMIVVFNLDPDTDNQHLIWLFSKFGEVKNVSESPLRGNQKFVTFFDLRHAGAALKAMNCAENLGKLPGQITPQQAASLAHISGSDQSHAQMVHPQGYDSGQAPLGSSYQSASSVDDLLRSFGQATNPLSGGSPSTGQGNLASPSLFSNSPTDSLLSGGHPTGSALFGSHGDLPTHLSHCSGMASTNPHALRLSDSASSIAAPAATKNPQLYGGSGGGNFLGNKNLNAQMAAVAATGLHGGAASGMNIHMLGGQQGAMDPGLGVYGSSPGSSNPSINRQAQQAQQLLTQSGMTPSAAADILRALNITQHHPFPHQGLSHARGQQPLPGGQWPHHLNPIVEGSEGPSREQFNSPNLWGGGMMGDRGTPDQNANAMAAQGRQPAGPNYLDPQQAAALAYNLAASQSFLAGHGRGLHPEPPHGHRANAQGISHNRPSGGMGHPSNSSG